MDPITVAAFGTAALGVGGFLADVALHLRTGRRVLRLESEVRSQVEAAKADRERILATVEAMGKRLDGIPPPPDVAAAVGPILAGLDELREAVPKRGAFAHGKVDPAEAAQAREDARDAAAATEVTLLAWATESLGESVGPAVIEWVRANAPDAYARALKNPRMAQTILTPAVALAQKFVGSAKRGASAPAGSDPFNPSYGR